ncbi:large conductance mechanosensitive channel protein MscL [Canibacter zhoujuaniae]|uniref:large conductance mechanosensitive channel protein MscL n=1 Tax=Canibacter zhoujuaniae TaxID=2708343 RepID=UPI0014246D00|nr:large conductance mechanosensitive channel protein MscL [Canibacter zhoujuaniae]
MLKGFKDFILRGNVVELAVAVIIAGAFGPIVENFTTQLLNLIGAIFGAPNFDSLGAFTINGAEIMPGTILTAIVNFLIVAAVIYFLVITPMNKVNDRLAAKKGVVEPEGEAGPTQEELLKQIRDLLANKQ